MNFEMQMMIAVYMTWGLEGALLRGNMERTHDKGKT